MGGVGERGRNRLEITGDEDGRGCYGKAGKNKQESIMKQKKNELKK
jgi:hypothetical protein